MTASRWTQPCDYYGTYKTSSWAGYYFKEPLGYTSGRHTGVDYNGPGAGNSDLGLPVRSVSNGVVRAIQDKIALGYGLTMIIEYPLTKKLKTELGCDSLFGRYMHFQSVNVSVGQEVTVGQQIGKMGNSGTTYAHLHVDLYKNTIEGGGVHWRYDKDTQLASYLDPYEFIQAHLVDDPDTVNLQPYQRVVGDTAVYYRTEPRRGAPLMKTDSDDDGRFEPGEIINFKGYVRGESVDDNDIWFVGRTSGGYSWSGGYTDSTTNGLSALAPESGEPNPTPVPEPTPTPPPMFGADSKLVSRVIPSPNFADVTQVPQFIVVHQWDDPAKNPTMDGVINHFLDPKVEVSAHYVHDGKAPVQMVQENKRAWHAGPQGNDGIGLELNPNADDAGYAEYRRLIADIRSRWGNLPLRGHNEFMQTLCPEYIELSELEGSGNSADLERRVTILEDKLARTKEIL